MFSLPYCVIFTRNTHAHHTSCQMYTMYMYRKNKDKYQNTGTCKRTSLDVRKLQLESERCNKRVKGAVSQAGCQVVVSPRYIYSCQLAQISNIVYT